MNKVVTQKSEIQKAVDFFKHLLFGNAPKPTGTQKNQNRPQQTGRITPQNKPEGDLKSGHEIWPESEDGNGY